MTNRRITPEETPVELEVKFYLSEPEQLMARLGKQNAELIIPRTLEQNWRYDDVNGDLKAQDRVLRLRQDRQVTLTYKAGKREESEVAEREELEVQVSDREMAHGILTALGYRRIWIYEKYRATYLLRGCEVVLDELPFGKFCEIEGPSPQEIRSLADQLGMTWDHRITCSYSALFDQLKHGRGLKFQDLTFENFRGINVEAADLGVVPAESSSTV